MKEQKVVERNKHQMSEFPFTLPQNMVWPNPLKLPGLLPAPLQTLGSPWEATEARQG